MSNELGNSKIVGRDLCVLARLLQDYGLCSDTSPLHNAGHLCQYQDDSWHYVLDKIVFRIDEVGHRIPFGSCDLSASLFVEIDSNEAIKENILEDPLKKLKFDIEVEGVRENLSTNDLDYLYSSWHLDRHIGKEGDGRNKYSHPMYHFTFGGNKMEDKGDVYGNCLILPSPRIAYPPMDAVLGIDFILQNYLHRDKISELLSDPEYISIVKRAQDRLVKPYFFSIVSFWNKSLFENEANHIECDNQFSNRVLYPLFY